MNLPHINQHIHDWLEKIEDNIEEYKTVVSTTTSAEDIDTITHQYHLMMLIHKALAGKVIFVGAKPIDAVVDTPTTEE